MNNPVIDCLLDHRTVRKFKDRPIEEDKLELILRSGTRAATGGNLQLYSFVVIDDQAKKDELASMWKHPAINLAKAPVIIIALADLNRLRRWFTLNDSVPVSTGRAACLFLSIWDSLIALQNTVIAAESLGLGTCYIGSVLELDIKKFLNTPDYVFPAGMVCLGYPEHLPDLSMRLPLEAIVHRNGYKTFTDSQIEKFYTERDAVWDRVPEKRKKMLAEQNLFGIAQAVASQKFSDKVTEERSRGILENLRQAKFDLTGESGNQ